MTRPALSSPTPTPSGRSATETPDRANTTLQSAKRRSGLSYQRLANRLSVKKWELYNYMVNGVEPEDPAARRRLNLDREGEWIVSVRFIRRDDLGRFT